MIPQGPCPHGPCVVLDLLEYTANHMVVGEFTQDTDVLVIGGGPGGYEAAFRAAQLGRNVLIVDQRGDLGGICLHEGCIPSKTRLHRIEHGLDQDDRGAKTISTLVKGLAAQAKATGVECLKGTAHFEDARTVQVTGEDVSRVRFKRAIIATGSTAIVRDGAVGPEHAATLQDIPGSCAVLGCDYLAVEAATMLAGEGAEVTLACGNDGLLPGLPRNLITPLVRALPGIGVTLDLEHEDIDAELVVDARSRTPAIELLRLSQAGITTDDSGWIEVDQQQRTSEPRIFAVGDVTGPPLLAGVALAQGRIAAEAICNIASAWDPAAVPHLVYSNPNVAFCGELVATDDSAITTIPWAFSGRAVGINAANGITMLHWHQESGLVLGVGICGADACELIETAVLAIEMGATLEDLAAIVPAHPTRSELLGQVARAALMDQASR